MNATHGMLVNLAAAAAIAGKPLILCGEFSPGIAKFHPIGPKARELLEELCPPSDPDHLWHQGDWYGLLVEERYANDLVEALRERGVLIP